MKTEYAVFNYTPNEILMRIGNINTMIFENEECIIHVKKCDNF